MLIAVALLFVPLISSSGEGNINLLEDEVAAALRVCTYNEDTAPKRNIKNHRGRRSNEYEYQSQYRNRVPHSDNGSTQDDLNIFNNEQRNSKHQMFVLNGTEDEVPGYDKTSSRVKFVGTAIIPNGTASYSIRNWTRRKRSDSLIKKSVKDPCLSQCVFANLQVVDGRGIPLEAEFWNKVQSAVMSQQSRTVLKDQIHACFQELQTGIAKSFKIQHLQ